MISALRLDVLMRDMTVCPVSDAEAALRLQRIVQQALSAEQQVYLKNRSLADYQELANEGCLQGMYLGAQLVSLVIFSKHRTEGYKTDFNPTQQFSAALDEVYDFGILGGLMVHPGYRGMGLAHRLVSVVVSSPESMALDRLFAETIAGNSFSINCFTRNGFDVLGYEHYAALNSDLCLLSLTPSALSDAVSVTKTA